jgi:anti-anti-sigma factor
LTKAPNSRYLWIEEKEAFMEIKEEKKGSIVIFSLKGRLDSAATPEVEKKILEAIKNSTHDIILDFSQLEYLSSGGIRLLVHCHKEIEKQGGQVFLSSVPKPIEHILYITGFLHYFKIYDKPADAIASLSKSI